MLKFYECKVCDVPCIGMPHDGATYEKEVCSPECLAQLQSAQQSVQPTLLESPRPEVESTLPQSG